MTCGLALVFILGAGMRFYGLGVQSLWLDEACTWCTAEHPTLRQVAVQDRTWNMYPPGYPFLMHFVVKGLGESEVLLRLPSAIVGTLAIALMFWVGARFWSYREGLVAAGFTAVSLFPIYYAQEARPYAGLLFLVLASTVAWSYVMEDLLRGRRPRGWVFGLHVVAGILTCYWHYFGLLFIVLQGAASVVILPRKVRSAAWVLAGYGLMALGFTAWLPGLWFHWSHQHLGPQNPVPGSGIFVSFFDYISAMFSHGRVRAPLSKAAAGAALAAMALVFLRGARAWRKAPKNPVRRRILWARGILLAGWLLLPFLLAFFKSTTSTSVFTHRNLTISLPAVYLLTARGLWLLPLPKRPVSHAVLAAVLLGAMLGRVLVFSGYYSFPHKDQFREAVDFVMQRQASPKGALVVGFGHNDATYRYYFKRYGVEHRLDLWAGREKDISELERLLEESRARYVWYLTADPYPDQTFAEYLNTHFTGQLKQEFSGVTVYLLEHRDLPPGTAEHPLGSSHLLSPFPAHSRLCALCASCGSIPFADTNAPPQARLLPGRPQHPLPI